MLHPDRLFPADPATRAVARSLHDAIARLPIVSPHGHTDPQWWGDNTPFANAAELLVIPDHYVTRMLVSQGVPFEALEAQGALRVEGDRPLARRFTTLFPLPPKAAAA